VGSREVRGIHISDRTVIISIIKIIYPIFFNFEKQTFEENLEHNSDTNRRNY
jgi:hypothetical protein